jgi:hypothetical protein
MIPELLNLGDFGITIAAVHEGTPLIDLEGMSRLTLSARLAYGSGGTSVVVVVQTSLNQGTSWIDIARFDFSTAGLEKVMNLTTVTSLTSPYSVISLVAEGGVNSVLGDRLRSVVTSTGTYTGSTVLAVRAMAT